MKLSFLKNCPRQQGGQSMVEYTIVLSIVVLVLFAMNPLIKRTSQGMIKVVADQIGIQNQADQQFDGSGHLQKSLTTTRASMIKETQEFLGTTNYIYDDTIETKVKSQSNLGVRPGN